MMPTGGVNLETAATSGSRGVCAGGRQLAGRPKAVAAGDLAKIESLARQFANRPRLRAPAELSKSRACESLRSSGRQSAWPRVIPAASCLRTLTASATPAQAVRSRGAISIMSARMLGCRVCAAELAAGISPGACTGTDAGASNGSRDAGCVWIATTCCCSAAGRAGPGGRRCEAAASECPTARRSARTATRQNAFTIPFRSSRARRRARQPVEVICTSRQTKGQPGDFQSGEARQRLVCLSRTARRRVLVQHSHCRRPGCDPTPRANSARS